MSPRPSAPSRPGSEISTRPTSTSTTGTARGTPHPFRSQYASGIPIEEVSDRILGYLAAYEAFGDPVFLERAEAGGEYLLRRRVYANGHVRLEGHLVVEHEYTFAARALLALWDQDRGRSDYLRAATLIGDRLLEEHLGGAIDHAVHPAQVLGPLYQLTGDGKYLRAALRRAFRAVRLQLPYGGWPGDDGRIWYHSIIGKSVIGRVRGYAEHARLLREERPARPVHHRRAQPLADFSGA